MKNKFIPFLFISFMMLACNKTNNVQDASGTFEAVETIVSAEANGKILALQINEGDQLKAGQVIGYIDSTQLHLTRLQLIQSRKAVLSGRPDVKIQIEALQKDLDNALFDKKRIENLVKGDVASQKQLDDINTKIAVMQSKIAAQKNVLNTTTTTINEQGNTVEYQLAQIEDQLRKCVITNPIDGTVLTQFAYPFEMTANAKPLYNIADLSTIILRVYVTGNQLAIVKLNQKVTVRTDDGKGGLKESQGVITWINDKAEFTPKTIQTKDERANIVYAVKVNVKNDGSFKIGMYGEVKLN